MCAAPASAVLRPFALDYTGGVATSYEMPLAMGPVPSEMFPDMLRTLSRLWYADMEPTNVASRLEYQGYILDRGASLERHSQGWYLLVLASQKYEAVHEKPVKRVICAHGDAIISNFVQTYEGPRAIDLSPRAAVPEIELDLAKLRFSALGFDIVDSERRQALAKLVDFAVDMLGADKALMQYHLAAHAVRVISREPPTDTNRITFFQEVARYVATN
jgi:hypothetical protein